MEQQQNRLNYYSSSTNKLTPDTKTHAKTQTKTLSKQLPPSMRSINSSSQLKSELQNLKHSSIRYKIYAFGSPLLEKLNSHKQARKICRDLDETEEILEVFWIKSEELGEEMNISFLPTIIVLNLKNVEIGRVFGKGVTSENIYRVIESDISCRNASK